MEDLLGALGCGDIEMTKARFLNDRPFYLELTGEMLRDPGFEQLGEQLAAQDAASAFDTAHMLKGITANCGITPLYDLIVQIVEPLRDGNPDFTQLLAQYGVLLARRDETEARIRRWEEAAEDGKSDRPGL